MRSEIKFQMGLIVQNKYRDFKSFKVLILHTRLVSIAPLNPQRMAEQINKLLGLDAEVTFCQHAG